MGDSLRLVALIALTLALVACERGADRSPESGTSSKPSKEQRRLARPHGMNLEAPPPRLAARSGDAAAGFDLGARPLDGAITKDPSHGYAYMLVACERGYDAPKTGTTTYSTAVSRNGRIAPTGRLSKPRLT